MELFTTILGGYVSEDAIGVLYTAAHWWASLMLSWSPPPLRYHCVTMCIATESESNFQHLLGGWYSSQLKTIVKNVGSNYIRLFVIFIGFSLSLNSSVSARSNGNLSYFTSICTLEYAILFIIPVKVCVNSSSFFIDILIIWYGTKTRLYSDLPALFYLIGSFTFFSNSEKHRKNITKNSCMLFIQVPQTLTSYTMTAVIEIRKLTLIKYYLTSRLYSVGSISLVVLLMFLFWPRIQCRITCCILIIMAS